MKLPSRPSAPSSALAALLLVAVACGGGGTGPSGDAAGRVLRVSQGSDILTFDPYFMLESPTFCIQINIFDPLTDIDPKMNVVPALAESWKVTGPTEWEFKLRAGVTFHEGQPFDAMDVQYSLKRAIDWAPSRVRSEIPTVREVRIVDPLTVRIETTVPDAILPRRLGSVLILDKESSEAGIAKEGDAWLATRANGTGPYRLKEWVKGSNCTLEANAAHWRGEPSVKVLQFLALSEAATRIASTLAGQLDVLLAVPVQAVQRIRAMPGFAVNNTAGLRLIYLGLDVSRDTSPGVPGSPPNPLKDLRVRQAIQQAINVDLLIQTIMSGQATPASQLFPDAIFGFDPSITRPPHDPELAKGLLAEAGFAKGFRLRLDSPNDRYPNDAKIAAAIAQQLAQVGIEVEVNATPKSSFFQAEKEGNSSFFLIGWANTNGDGNGTFDHLLHTLDRTKNLGDSNTSTLYSNTEVDRLSEAAAAEFDEAKRLALLQEASRLTMADLPHIPLYIQNDISAVSRAVEWTPRRDTQLRGIEVRWKN